jgi:hypothetical protein
MKTRSDALGTAENESGRKIWKLDPTHSAPPKTSLEEQNMKMRPDALGTAKKRVREHKTWKRDPTPSVSPKTSSEEQNMKTEPDTLGTAKKRVWAQNMKTGHGNLRTAENEFVSSKHENVTQRPRYHGNFLAPQIHIIWCKLI